MSSCIHPFRTRPHLTTSSGDDGPSEGAATGDEVALGVSGDFPLLLGIERGRTHVSEQVWRLGGRGPILVN